MNELVQFLLARIHEDAEFARTEENDWGAGGPDRWLAECEAIHRVITAVTAWTHRDLSSYDCWYSCPLAVRSNGDPACCNEDAVTAGVCNCGLESRQFAVLAPLTLIFADHPDYREEWDHVRPDWVPPTS